MPQNPILGTKKIKSSKIRFKKDWFETERGTKEEKIEREFNIKKFSEGQEPEKLQVSSVSFTLRKKPDFSPILSENPITKIIGI